MTSIEDLPVIIQKSIRDSEKDKETNLKLISDAVGVPFTFEADYVTLHNNFALPKIKDKFPSLIHSDYLSKFAANVGKFVSNPVCKSALLGAVTERKIRFEFGEVSSGSSMIVVKDGVLIIVVPANKFMTNHAFVGKDLITAFDSDASVLPLSQRQALYDTENDRVTILNKLKELTGQDWTLDIDYFKLYTEPSLKITAKAKGNFVECIVKEYLVKFVANLADMLKDDLVKKSFEKKVTVPKLVFEFAEQPKVYHKTSIRDGALVITIPPKQFMTNHASVGKDLEANL